MWDSPNLLLFDKITFEPRCGMLYMDGAPLTWDLLVTTWTHTLPEAINRSLREMVSRNDDDFFKFSILENPYLQSCVLFLI